MKKNLPDYYAIEIIEIRFTIKTLGNLIKPKVYEYGFLRGKI